MENEIIGTVLLVAVFVGYFIAIELIYRDGEKGD